VKHYTRSELVGAMDLLLQCNQRSSPGIGSILVLQQALVQLQPAPDGQSLAATG